MSKAAEHFLGNSLSTVPPQKDTLVHQLGGDDPARDPKSTLRVIRGPILLLAEPDVGVGQAVAHAVQPSTARQVDDRLALAQERAVDGLGRRHGPHQHELRDFSDPNLSELLVLPVEDDEEISVLADGRSGLLHVEREPMAGGRKEEARGRRGLAEESRLIREADGCQRAAHALGAVHQWRRQDARRCGCFQLLELRERQGDELVVELDQNALVGSREVQDARIAAIAMLPQEETLGAYLHALGLVRPTRYMGAFPLLGVDRLDPVAVDLDQVDLRDQAELGIRELDRAELLDATGGRERGVLRALARALA